MFDAILGLAGEAGEVADKFKKCYRDKNGRMSKAFKEEIKKELGDCQWYIAAIATLLDFTLEDVVKSNIDKLEDRYNRGVQRGSGDNR